MTELPWKKMLPPLAAIACCAGVLYLLLTILPGITSLEVDIAADHPDMLRVYYANTGIFLERYKTQAQIISRERSLEDIPIKDMHANRLRIDPGDKPGAYRIYQIRLHSGFHPSVTLGPAEIMRLFSAGHPKVVMSLVADHVEVAAHGEDPYIVANGRLLPRMTVPVTLIALLAGVLTFLLLRTTTAGGQIEDRPTEQRPSHIATLNGLRGIAAIMVVADHTWGWFKGTGASGVWIFFALSGFLLTRPFVHQPRQILSLAALQRYLFRRFSRILPMYYAYLTVVFLLSNRLDTALLHALFLQGAGHLWAVPQEVVFYLLLPLLVLPLCLVPPRLRLMVPPAILLLALGWNRFIGPDTLWLLGMKYQKLPLFFGIFCMGAFFAFLHEGRREEAEETAWSNLLRRAASPLGLGLLLFLLLGSTGRIFGREIVYSQEYLSLYGFAAGLLILCSALAPVGSLLGRLLTLRPLRTLGIIGFSLYLLHPLVKTLLQSIAAGYFHFTLTGGPLFLLTLGVTALVAAATYSRIERPLAADRRLTFF